MIIDTKFDINQDVFLLFKDKVHEVEINHISIEVTSDILEEPVIKYSIAKNPAGNQWTKIFLEHELYKTKQDLLDAL